MPDTRTLHIQSAPEPACQLCGATRTYQTDVVIVVRYGTEDPLLTICDSCLLQLRDASLRRHLLDSQEAMLFIADDCISTLKERLAQNYPDR